MYVLLSQRIRHSYCCSDLLKCILNRRIPQVTGILTQMKSHPSKGMPEADLSAIYRYKEYPHSSYRSVPLQVGTKKIPRNEFYQIVQLSMSQLSDRPVASGHKKRSRSTCCCRTLSRRRLPTLPLAQYHRRDEA